MKPRILLFLSFFLLSQVCLSQDKPVLRISIIADYYPNTPFTLVPDIEKEVDKLLVAYDSLIIERHYCGYDTLLIRKTMEEAFADPLIKIIIGAGPVTSSQMVHIKHRPKPVIASLVFPSMFLEPMDSTNLPKLQNLSYILPPIDIRRDLSVFHQIFPFKTIAVISSHKIIQALPGIKDNIQRQAHEMGAESVFWDAMDYGNPNSTAFRDTVQAVYMTPVEPFLSEKQIRSIMDSLNERKIPIFSLMSDPYMDFGALGAHNSSELGRRIPRRVALNCLKILEGTDPADISPLMEIEEELIINMAIASKTGVYPTWKMISRARLINVDEVTTGGEMSIQGAILRAMDENLGYKIQQIETEVSEQDIKVARSDYLPQVEVGTDVNTIDQRSVLGSFGSKGRVTWVIDGSVNQLIFSEPTMANIAISQHLKQSQQYFEDQTMLDLILDVSSAYFQILQSKRFAELQNDNVHVTRENYEIAKKKEAVGYGGVSDVYRWESELARNNADLIQARADLRKARFQLNNVLNQPIDSNYAIVNIQVGDSIKSFFSQRIFSLAENPGDIQYLSDFLVMDAFHTLPEIRQLEATIQAQEREWKSLRRSHYLPTVALGGQANMVLQRWQVLTIEGIPQFDPSNYVFYNLGVGVNFPLVTGLRRNAQTQQSKLKVQQLHEQKRDLYNQLETIIRSNLEQLSASYNNLNLSRKAAIAANKNFTITQDAYSNGTINITSLIDAQNAALQANINEMNASYIFIVDLLQLERSLGRFSFFMSPEEQDAQFEHYEEYLRNVKKN